MFYDETLARKELEMSKKCELEPHLDKKHPRRAARPLRGANRTQGVGL